MYFSSPLRLENKDISEEKNSQTAIVDRLDLFLNHGFDFYYDKSKNEIAHKIHYYMSSYKDFDLNRIIISENKTKNKYITSDTMKTEFAKIIDIKDIQSVQIERNMIYLKTRSFGKFHMTFSYNQGCWDIRAE